MKGVNRVKSGAHMFAYNSICVRRLEVVMERGEREKRKK